MPLKKPAGGYVMLDLDKERIRRLIKELEDTFKDTRPSRNISPLGAGAFIIALNQDTIEHDSKLKGRQVVNQIAEEILSHCPVSQPFKDHLQQIIDVNFVMAAPAEYVVNMFGVGQDDWRLFHDETAGETERYHLEYELKQLFLNMIGSMLIMIPQEQEAQMSITDTAAVLESLLTDESGCWASVEEFEEYADSTLRIWRGNYVPRIDHLLEWVGGYRSVQGSTPPEWADAVILLQKLKQYE